MDEDELLEIARAVKERLGKNAIMMAKTRNINVDPYYTIIGYCGSVIYSVTVEEDSLVDEIRVKYETAHELGCYEVTKFIDLIEEIYDIHMISSEFDFDADRNRWMDLLNQDKRGIFIEVDWDKIEKLFGINLEDIQTTILDLPNFDKRNMMIYYAPIENILEDE